MTERKLETLSEHNKRVGSAGVACDKCGAGMEHDAQTQRWERMDLPTTAFEPRRGEPVICPKCGYKGRKYYGLGL